MQGGADGGREAAGGWVEARRRRQLLGQGDAGGEGTLKRPHANGLACQELADLPLSKPQGLGCTHGER